MARSKLIVSGKIKASSLLEVLISMIIIMIIFGTAIMIFTNVTQSSLSVKKINAEKILNDQLLNAEKYHIRTDQTFTVNNFTITREVKSYNDNSGLTEIDLIAYDSNQQKISELHKVVITGNE